MNYEEMLNAQDGVATHREKIPVGEFYKKLIDRKYRNVVELKPKLADNIRFCEALKANQKWNAKQNTSQQLHYEAHEDSNGIYELELEQGNYQTLAQLLDTNPAAVASKGFVSKILNDLMDYTVKMHNDGVFHLCYAPQNIFVRKGDNAPMLLFHGSFFQGIDAMREAYGEVADYMAPEVMAGESVNESSDVYGIGKLIEYLYSQGTMPIEYKKAVKKATAASPNQRFSSIDQLRSAIVAKRNTVRSFMALAAAVAIALLCVWLYIELVPQTTVVEFVEPAPREQSDDDLFGTYYDPETGLLMEDTLAVGANDHIYQSKAEEIFRKRFEREAEKALSKVYDNDRMGAGEKTFMAGSQSMIEDLMTTQRQLGEETGLTDEQAARIGQEIMSKITSQKQAELTRQGYIKAQKDEDSIQ